jgi:hypothetical protein
MISRKNALMLCRFVLYNYLLLLFASLVINSVFEAAKGIGGERTELFIAGSFVTKCQNALELVWLLIYM